MIHKLNRYEYRALSSACINFSAVFLASLVLPVITGSFDLNNIPVLSLGLVGTFVALYLALICARRGK